jgi:hypothetical protein
LAHAHEAIFNAFPWIGVSLECLAKKRIGMLTVRVDDVLQQMILGREMVEEGLVGNIRFLDDGRDARAGNPVFCKQFQGRFGDLVTELGFPALDTANGGDHCHSALSCVEYTYTIVYASTGIYLYQPKGKIDGVCRLHRGGSRISRLRPRLSAGHHSPHSTVLLLEAGSTARNPMLHIPLGFAFLLKPHKNNWGYRTQAEPYLNQREIDLPRGKVLGGCSAINGMVYVRGQAEDFDRWAELGNTGWAYNDVLPYFKRSEDCENGANAYHG